jgi:hypothetical protein
MHVIEVDWIGLVTLLRVCKPGGPWPATRPYGLESCKMAKRTAQVVFKYTHECQEQQIWVRVLLSTRVVERVEIM